MRLSDLKVHQKIAFSVALLLLASTSVPAFVAFFMVSRTLDQRVQKQVESASAMISETNFATNADVLERLKRAVNADIITYSESGGIIASTLGPEHNAFSANIYDPQIFETILKNGQTISWRSLNFDGVPYLIAYRPVTSRPDAIVAFVADVSDKAQAEAAIGRTIVILAIVVVLILFVSSQVLARSISAPLLELVAVTKAVAAGDMTTRAGVRSGDEIGLLASSLNNMIDELKDSKERLVGSEKLAVAGLLAARVAHDVRNPLSSIKMQVQLLQGRLVPGPGNQELARAILAQVDRVDMVVKGLLDLARPEALKTIRTNLHEILDDILRQIDAQMRHRKIVVTTDFDPSVPDLDLDVDRLTQGLLNVLLNAEESMPVGGAIHISTRLESAQIVRLEISDRGEGIDPKIRDRIFEPFVSTKIEGVGLGLMNARSVVERHGGTIELKPRQGGGTSAIIRLPIGRERRHEPRESEKIRG